MASSKSNLSTLLSVVQCGHLKYFVVIGNSFSEEWVNLDWPRGVAAINAWGRVSTCGDCSKGVRCVRVDCPVTRVRVARVAVEPSADGGDRLS